MATMVLIELPERERGVLFLRLTALTNSGTGCLVIEGDVYFLFFFAEQVFFVF